MKFGNRNIQFGENHPCQSIIEIGVNHNGDMDIARKMVDVIKNAGGNIVKFQAFIASEEISIQAEKAEYQKEVTGNQGGQLKMAEALELSHGQLMEARDYCAASDVPFLCTAFESKSLDFLVHKLGLETIKIASSEVTAHPFLAEIASSNCSMILSTGASTLEEVAAAVRVIEEARPDPDLAILHCVSEYPAPFDQINLRAMRTLATAFGYPIGYSDHTQGIDAPIAAAALGACAIEKHFTLDRTMPGPDHNASIEANELELMCKSIISVQQMLGDGVKKPAPCEMHNIDLIRKSIVARRALPAGHILKEEDIALKRPATGIEPKFLDMVLGRELKTDLEQDTPIHWSNL